MGPYRTKRINGRRPIKLIPVLPPNGLGGIPYPQEYPSLTGGRKAEILGLEVKDVSFARKTVTFRPNERRRVKTRTSPPWPQLEEILRPYVFSATAPRGEGFLFPDDRGDGMIWDLR